MGEAAQGDSSGVASAVEAALCQAIPLAIDLLLRLAGINVGGKIQEILNKIRKPIQSAIDKVVGSFKGKVGNSKVGRTYKR